MDNMEQEIINIGKQAKQAARILMGASPEKKNNALSILAKLLDEKREQIFAANAKDVQEAKLKNMDQARLDRLMLTDNIINEMIAACKHVANLPDPVGAMTKQWQRPNGLLVGRMRIPLGVIAMIYESRPNVTIDAAILCLKAGNAVILRGGSEALHSNLILATLLNEALMQAHLPGHAAQLIKTTDRNVITLLCGLEEYIDVIIPRGGEALVRSVTKQATMPVLKHYIGVCHAFIDSSADLGQAIEIVYNGKVQRPGVCNALECVLVHADIANDFLPMLGQKLGQAGVEFRACANSLPLLGKTATLQSVNDLGYEFHALILAVCVVKNMDAALDHIACYGSQHTEIICTNDHAHAMRFMREVDASMTAVNASTRFNDGGQLGLGAEIGISTSKLHSYGPMGVEELTTTKFVVFGQGQVRL